MRIIIVVQALIVTLTLFIIYHQLSAFVTIPVLVKHVETILIERIPVFSLLTPLFESYKLIFIIFLALISYKDIFNGKCSGLVVLAILIYSLTLIEYFRTLIGIQALSKSAKILIGGLLDLFSVDHNIIPLEVSLIEGIVLISLYIVARESENLYEMGKRFKKGSFPPDDINKTILRSLLFLISSLMTSVGILGLMILFQSIRFIVLVDVKVSLLMSILLITVVGLVIYRLYKQ